jgi:hypothetical protein
MKIMKIRRSGDTKILGPVTPKKAKITVQKYMPSPDPRMARRLSLPHTWDPKV